MRLRQLTGLEQDKLRAEYEEIMAFIKECQEILASKERRFEIIKAELVELKDKFGDDLILNGKKVPVPSAEYKYMFQKDNIVSMKQTNLETNSSYIYEGTYSIKSEDNKIFILECNLHYKQKDANPINTIVINKIDKRPKIG